MKFLSTRLAIEYYYAERQRRSSACSIALDPMPSTPEQWAASLRRWTMICRAMAGLPTRSRRVLDVFFGAPLAAAVVRCRRKNGQEIAVYLCRIWRESYHCRCPHIDDAERALVMSLRQAARLLGCEHHTAGVWLAEAEADLRWALRRMGALR